MRWVALALLAGCSLNRSAEREDSFAQQGESRREEGPWTRETWEWAPAALVPDGPLKEHAKSDTAQPERNDHGPLTHGTSVPLLRHTVETHAPVVSTSTTTVEASGEAKEARSARFGWSPWTIAIGALVALAGLYGLWRLKAKLAL